jgi:1-phosphofructokinase
VAECAVMLVAGPNLALQRVADLDRLRPGEVLRFERSEVSAGGKGVNVCRAARRLGATARLVTFAAGVTGRATVALAEAEGMRVCAVPTAGEARVATIVREADGRVTVLNEPGPPVSAADWGAFAGTVARELEAGEVLVCTGTLPPGAPDGAYAELVEVAHARGARVLVDAHGELLRRALAARPELAKPNLVEAEATLDGTRAQPVALGGGARERALAAAGRVLTAGAGGAVVTAGEQGAALAGDGEPLWVAAPRVEAVNPIGAGDCFAAVLAAGMEAGRPLRESFAYAVAVAAASVEQPLPGDFDPRRARELA